MKLVLLVIWVFMGTFIIPSGQSETLVEITELSHLQDSTMHSAGGRLSAILLGGDSAVFTNGAGLFVRWDSSRDWQRLVGCVSMDKQVPFSTCDSKRLESLIMPDGLVRLSGSGDVIAVHEHFCGRLYTLRFGDDGEGYLEKRSPKKSSDHYDVVVVQDDLMLCELRLTVNNKVLALQRTDGSDYRRIWSYPPSLLRRLDSVGISGESPSCYPAFNPHDSTLWLAIGGYDFIYITDMDGQIRDSVHINATDYRLPPPPKSRIKSSAVTSEWLSQWTRVTSFVYVAPGYFLLQYYIGREVHGETGVGLYSTLVWNADGEPVALDVDKHWKLAGVQPDGRIILGHYDFEDERFRVVLNVVRIE